MEGKSYWGQVSKIIRIIKDGGKKIKGITGLGGVRSTTRNKGISLKNTENNIESNNKGIKTIITLNMTSQIKILKRYKWTGKILMLNRSIQKIRN